MVRATRAEGVMTTRSGFRRPPFVNTAAAWLSPSSVSAALASCCACAAAPQTSSIRHPHTRNLSNQRMRHVNMRLMLLANMGTGATYRDAPTMAGCITRGVIYFCPVQLFAHGLLSQATLLGNTNRSVVEQFNTADVNMDDVRQKRAGAHLCFGRVGQRASPSGLGVRQNLAGQQLHRRARSLFVPRWRASRGGRRRQPLQRHVRLEEPRLALPAQVCRLQR